MNKLYDRSAACFLHSVEGLTNSKISKLLKKYSSYSNIISADQDSLASIIGSELALAIIDKRSKQDIDDDYARLQKEGIDFFIPPDPEYPSYLKNLSSPPAALYVLGKLPDSRKPSVAIIGARNCSAYGRQMARTFSRQLSANGIQIISGLARGIDGIAQNAALEGNNYTCGVLGCGVNICYPKENQDIYDKCIQFGGLISEYPPGTPPNPRHFPARNRIISGLADAIIVIEAREHSGTLITVDMALSQGKDIYALPGRTTDPLSYGCNELIKNGASPLLSPDMFISEFLERFYLQKGYEIHGFRPSDSVISPIQTSKSPKYTDKFLTTRERSIIKVLDYTPKSISQIYSLVNATTSDSFSIPTLMQELTSMTLQGKIKCIDGSNYYIEED